MIAFKCSASEASSSLRAGWLGDLLDRDSLSIIRPIGCSRLAPVTQQASTAACIMSLSSMGAGATYLPLLVLNRSFTRPVIFRLPAASRTPLSPVRNQPSSVNACLRQLGLLVVAEHRRRALDLDLAVGWVQPALHTLVGLPHGAERPLRRHRMMAGSRGSRSCRSLRRCSGRAGRTSAAVPGAWAPRRRRRRCTGQGRAQRGSSGSRCP